MSPSTILRRHDLPHPCPRRVHREQDVVSVARERAPTVVAMALRTIHTADSQQKYRIASACEIYPTDGRAEGMRGDSRDPEQMSGHPCTCSDRTTPRADRDTTITADIKHIRVVLSSEAEPNSAGSPTRPQPSPWVVQPRRIGVSAKSERNSRRARPAVNHDPNRAATVSHAILTVLSRSIVFKVLDRKNQRIIGAESAASDPRSLDLQHRFPRGRRAVSNQAPLTRKAHPLAEVVNAVI